MLSSGVTQKEVEQALGLEGDRPVHNLLKRERKKELHGIRKSRGRKPARTLQEYPGIAKAMAQQWAGKAVE